MPGEPDEQKTGRLADYDYFLPPERIAQSPLPERDQSRLLVVNRAADRIEDHRFSDLPQYLEPGDVLVINDTEVNAQRLWGARPGHPEERVETFLTHRISDGLWQGLVRPGKKLPPGAIVAFRDGLRADVLERTDARGGRLLRFSSDQHGLVDTQIAAQASAPLPPYITQQLPTAERGRYQTVYAAHAGSAAAPTAGLHFTPSLLETIAARGVKIARVTLHVGLGTFRPIEADDIRTHTMHAERVTVTSEAAEMINSVSGKIVAVGTTSARTLESAASADHKVAPFDGETSLYITPGDRFRVVDALITNFHMPRSTLMVLVSALAGRDLIRRAYAHALEEGYRFLSFGDAMLII